MTTTKTPPARWTIAGLVEALGVRADDVADLLDPSDLDGQHLTAQAAARVIEAHAVRCTARVIDGYLDLDADAIPEDDDRWLIVECPVTGGLVSRIEVGAWGVDEEDMTRADRGLSLEGLSRVGDWIEDGAETWTTWVVRRTDRELRGWVPDRPDASLVIAAPGRMWTRPGWPEGAAKATWDLDALDTAMSALAERGPDLADLPARGWTPVPHSPIHLAGTRHAAVRAYMPGVLL